MPDSVRCSYDGCTFQASKIEKMTEHQTQVRHPGWSNIDPEEGTKSWVCGKCDSRFIRWGVLYVHLATHSLPYACSECEYKASRVARLKSHVLKHHGHEIETSNRWALQKSNI